METNQEVIANWFCGSKGKSNNLSTDGYKLYSYAKQIGFTSDHKKYVINYTAKTIYHSGLKLWGSSGSYKGKFISKATSNHIGEAIRYIIIRSLRLISKIVIPPDLWNKYGEISATFIQLGYEQQQEEQTQEEWEQTFNITST
tara:strand:+ start:294 stop:722 length:429 start_codon:yes stop_codon:yes gene_type:complete